MRMFRNKWKALCALLLVALLLLCTGCAAQSSGSALPESIGQWADTLPSMPPTTNAPGGKATVTPGADLAASAWEQRLEGWWVDVDRFAHPKNLLLLYFTQDGYAYDSLQYDAMLEGEAVNADTWTLADGELFYTLGINGDRARIAMDGDETLRLEWEDGSPSWTFQRPGTQRATALLMGSDHFYLVQEPRLSYLLLGEELSDDDRYATVWLNDATWVDIDDEALIAQYGLEDHFEHGSPEYCIYSDDAGWRPMFVLPDETVFCIITYDDGVTWTTVDFAAFLAFVEEQAGESGPLLVYYSGEDADGIVYAVRQVYLA